MENVKDQYLISVKKKKGESGSAAEAVKNNIYHEQVSFLDVLSMDKNQADSRLEVDPDKSPDGLDEGQEDSDTMEKPYEADQVSATEISASKPSLKMKEIDTNRKILEHLCTKEDRHLSFFKGLFPSLEEFTDDETLQFQSGVIQVIQNIKKDRSFPVEVIYYSQQEASNTGHSSPFWNNPSPRGREGSEPISPNTFGSQVKTPPYIPVSPVSFDSSNCSFTLDGASTSTLT